MKKHWAITWISARVNQYQVLQQGISGGYSERCFETYDSREKAEKRAREVAAELGGQIVVYECVSVAERLSETKLTEPEAP